MKQTPLLYLITFYNHRILLFQLCNIVHTRFEIIQAFISIYFDS